MSDDFKDWARPEILIEGSTLIVGDQRYFMIPTNIPFNIETYAYTRMQFSTISIADLHNNNGNVAILLYLENEEDYIVSVLRGDINDSAIKQKIHKLEKKYENTNK